MESTSVLEEDGASSLISLSFSLTVLLFGNGALTERIMFGVVPVGLEALLLLEGEPDSIAMVAFVEGGALKVVESIVMDIESLY